MSDKKSFGQTVLGWFVTTEEETPSSTDALIEKYASEPAPAGPAVELKGELPVASDGNVDFPAVFAAANVSKEEQDRIDKAMNLLKSLPAQTPTDVKKQIVEASLKAFGVPIDQIIESGVLEIQSLQAYIQAGQKHTQVLIEESKSRIAALTEEIARLNTAMLQAADGQLKLEQACNHYKLRVQEVLEFFGQEAVARVVHASPKLVEPT